MSQNDIWKLNLYIHHEVGPDDSRHKFKMYANGVLMEQTEFSKRDIIAAADPNALVERWYYKAMDRIIDFASYLHFDAEPID